MSAFRAVVLGGVDGIITSFAIAASASAGGLDEKVVVVVGTASLFADGVSMGVSEYVSSSAAQSEQRYRGEQVVAARPVVLGAACFAAFVACGSVPVIAYVATRGDLLASAMFSIVALMLLGAARTHVSRERLLAGVLQTALLGSLAGMVAYVAGSALAD